MFDFIKDKLKSFSENIVKKEEEKLSFEPTLKHKVKSLVSRKIKLKESDFDDLLDELATAFG